MFLAPQKKDPLFVGTQKNQDNPYKNLHLLKDSGEVELDEKFTSKLKELESLVIPMLKGLMKNAEKEYIYWPNRTPILEKQIEKVYSITRPE